MNTFYHVDKSHKLQTGMKISLSPTIPSKFGKYYVDQLSLVNITEFGTLEEAYQQQNKIIDKSIYREFWLEIFRKDCPDLKSLSLKSRLNSFFATTSVKDACRFIERSEIKSEVRIFEVYSSDKGLKLDMTWLDHKFPRDFKAFQYYYTHYWQGLKIEEDEHLKGSDKRGSLIEVLIDKDVMIGEVIKTFNPNIGSGSVQR